MSTLTNLKRITIELPEEDYCKLSAHAAHVGKSMQEIILEVLQLMEPCLSSDHIPNKKTAKAIKDAQRGKNLIKMD